MDINEQAKQLIKNLESIEDEIELIQQTRLEKDNALKENVRLNNKTKDTYHKYALALSAVLTAGIGLGITELFLIDKAREVKLLETDVTVVSQDAAWEEEPIYIEAIDGGKEEILLEYCSWEEKNQKGILGQSYATYYQKDTYAYNITGIEQDYLDIDTTNLSGELIESEISYNVPEDLESLAQRLLIYLNQEQDARSITILNEENDSFLEGLIVLLLIITLLVTGVLANKYIGEIKYFRRIIKNNKKMQKALLEELDRLYDDYINKGKNKEEITNELMALYDLFEKEITDESVISVCKRIRNN